MHRKLISLFVSMRFTVGLLVFTLVLALTDLYVSVGMWKNIFWYGKNISLLVIGFSIALCTGRRLRSLIGRARSETGSVKLKEKWEPDPAITDPLAAITETLTRSRYRVSFSNNQINAEKNRWGLLGSLCFHLGVVIVFAGFAVNALWSFRGTMLLPERVPLKVPQDLHYSEKGWLFKEPKGMLVGLNRFFFRERPQKLGQPLLEPIGDLLFSEGDEQWSREVKVNYPAQFGGLNWRYSDSGYSLQLMISDKTGVLVNDFVNIASHGGVSWYDTFVLSGGRQLEINFFPDFASKNGTKRSVSRLPNNPVMELKIGDGSIRSDSAQIPLGSTVTLNSYTVTFSGYRYWMTADVSYDPGKHLIFWGGWVAIAGLVCRVLFVTRRVSFRLETDSHGKKVVTWGGAASYGNTLYRQQIESILIKVGGRSH